MKYLQSSMDRLKPFDGIKTSVSTTNLQSSMDRLKLWFTVNVTSDFIHLQSSMDRLKPHRLICLQNYAVIYNPVWID